MAIVDGPAKVSFILTQALAARALADAVPDPHAKRIAARGVFVAVDSFITLARQTRNAVPRSKANKANLIEIKQSLNDLADRDWGPYEQIRDRIGAHRQPIGGGDDVEGWAAANALWAEIDGPLVGVLCDDMTAIHSALSRVAGSPAVSPPGLAQAALDAIAAAPEFQPKSEGLRLDTGSFGETQEGTTTPLQGGTIGERLRQVSDTIDGFEFYATVEGMVAGNTAFERVVLAGVIIETANIIELVFDVPAGRAAENRYLSLIELIPTNYPEKADLDAARASLTAADVDWIRDLRNSIAAHVDSKSRLASLLAKLDGTDARRLNDLFHFVTGALDETDSRHAITVISPMRRLRGAVLSDLRRIDPPEHPASY